MLEECIAQIYYLTLKNHLSGLSLSHYSILLSTLWSVGLPNASSILITSCWCWLTSIPNDWCNESIWHWLISGMYKRNITDYIMVEVRMLTYNVSLFINKCFLPYIYVNHFWWSSPIRMENSSIHSFIQQVTHNILNLLNLLWYHHHTTPSKSD